MLLRRYKNRHIGQQVKEPAVPSEEEKSLEDMTVEELKAYAEENEIDLGRSSSHDGILKKIQDATEEPAVPSEEETQETETTEETE